MELEVLHRVFFVIAGSKNGSCCPCTVEAKNHDGFPFKECISVMGLLKGVDLP